LVARCRQGYGQSHGRRLEEIQGFLRRIRPWPPLSSIGVDKRGTMPQPMFDLKTSTTAILTDDSYIHRNLASTAI
jgi:hypothetical protein